MSLIKLIIGIVTLAVSGLVQFYAASISLPAFFTANNDPTILLLSIAIFASANLLVAGAIILIYSRFEEDSRMGAVLYFIGSIPLIITGSKEMIFVGVLAFGVALALFVNYELVTR